jgi:hypothetical protein
MIERIDGTSIEYNPRQDWLDRLKFRVWTLRDIEISSIPGNGSVEDARQTIAKGSLGTIAEFCEFIRPAEPRPGLVYIHFDGARNTCWVPEDSIETLATSKSMPEIGCRDDYYKKLHGRSVIKLCPCSFCMNRRYKRAGIYTSWEIENMRENKAGAVLALSDMTDEQKVKYQFYASEGGFYVAFSDMTDEQRATRISRTSLTQLNKRLSKSNRKLQAEEYAYQGGMFDGQ